MDIARDVTRLFRTLSDETRFRILRLLAREELKVNELAEITQLAQPRVSNHLKILREENLIVERRDGASRNYRVDQEALPESAQAVWKSLEAAWQDGAYAPDDKRLADVLAARAAAGRGGFFDQLAGRWDAVREGLFGESLGREILRTFLPPGLVVADVGTGTGSTLELFGPRAAKLIAIDSSEAMLDAARAKAKAAGLNNVEFRLADVQDKSPLSAGEADVITIVQVLHHLESPGETVKMLAAGLKPGGLMIVNDFLQHEEGWLRSDFEHRWMGFEKQKVARWISAAGLKLNSWEVAAGKAHELRDGARVQIPDAFTAVAGKG
ncbi:metalloregulator ArsR/SmtB family transcription factor [soil metagenome]